MFRPKTLQADGHQIYKEIIWIGIKTYFHGSHSHRSQTKTSMASESLPDSSLGTSSLPPLTADRQKVLDELFTSAVKAQDHEPRREEIQAEYDRWEQAVEFATGKRHEPRVSQLTIGVLWQALKPYIDLSNVPAQYHNHAKDYNNAILDLFKRDFESCAHICEALQADYWIYTEGTEDDAFETWAPDASLWIPIMFWKTTLIQILLLPMIDHKKGKTIIDLRRPENLPTENAERSRQLAKRSHRWIPNPVVIIRLLTDEKRRKRLIHLGTTQEGLKELGIRESDEELDKIRFWYWYRPHPLVFAAPAA
ncbi:MAG: hypothetical protein Q9168_001484 [Polycauliona sp. 1 TL-2023]